MPTAFDIGRNEQTALTAQRVMHRISEDRLKPLPPVFAVLYAHYDGTNPDISGEIRKLDTAKTSLTTSLCEELHDKYLSVARERNFIDEATRRMQEVVGEISAMIRDSGSHHQEYNKNLMRQSDTLSSATDLAQIKALVTKLVSDTHAMVEKNHTLESKLHDSSQQLQQMRQDISNLKQETLTDALTGIGNRKAFDADIVKRAGDAIEKGVSFGLIMADIDHFKVFNDTYGHQVGDQVLRLVARTLSEGLRPTEILSRYGGEEFCILVSGGKMRDVEKLADKLRERIAAKDIINQAKQEKLGRLSISLGIAQFHPGEPLGEFIDRADRALYKAKELGRNQFVSIEYDKNLHDKHHGNVVIDEMR